MFSRVCTQFEWKTNGNRWIRGTRKERERERETKTTRCPVPNGHHRKNSSRSPSRLRFFSLRSPCSIPFLSLILFLSFLLSVPGPFFFSILSRCLSRVRLYLPFRRAVADVGRKAFTVHRCSSTTRLMGVNGSPF